MMVIIKRILFLIAFDSIWTNVFKFFVFKFFNKYNIAAERNTNQVRKALFACGLFGCFFGDQIWGGMVTAGAALYTFGQACVQMAQTLVSTVAPDVPILPTWDPQNFSVLEIFPLFIAPMVMLATTLRLVASLKVKDSLFANILQRTAAEWYDELVVAETDFFAAVCMGAFTGTLLYYCGAERVVDGLVYVLELMDDAGITAGRLAWFFTVCRLGALAARRSNYWMNALVINEDEAQIVYKIVSSKYFTAAIFVIHFLFPHLESYQAFMETVRGSVISSMAFCSEVNVVGVTLSEIMQVIVYSIAFCYLHLAARRKYISWLSAKGAEYKAQREAAVEEYRLVSSRQWIASFHIQAFFIFFFLAAYVENPVPVDTHCRAFLRTTHSIAQAASDSAKTAFWSLKWDLAPIDQESSIGNETEWSTANLTTPLTLEAVPSPPSQLYSPFENIELVQSWMTPSYLDENQGVALFALHELWFPAADDAENHAAEVNAADAGCCKQNDLTCRIKAIAIDYVPELARYLLDATPDGESVEDDTFEPEGNTSLDFAGFVLSYEHTIFRIQEIAEPVVPKKPVSLNRAELSALTPSKAGSHRCNPWIVSWLPVVSSLEYHRCMHSSFLNMSPTPVPSASTADQGGFSDDGAEDNNSAPINSSFAQAQSNAKSSAALSIATDSNSADASDPTHMQASTDLAPARSPALFVATDGQSPADGIGEPPSNNEIAADPVRICSDNDSLWDVASEALRLIQTYVQENLKTTLLGDPFTP